MSTVRHENVKWVDGLRGIASLLVVWTHIARAFDEDLFKPVSAETGVAPRLLQYPILRILVQGRIGVSIFSLVTGYVCALKPIRQFRAGQHDQAFVGIAKSAFRRIPRLFLPTTIATVIVWFICQFGVFEVSNRATGWWLNYTAPEVTPYIGPAVQNLILNIITTWTRMWDAYDNNQWTLQPLLKGAFLIYIMLFATAYTKPRYRMMIELGMFVYYYVGNDSAFGMQFFFGAFLSDLAQLPSHTAWVNSRKWPGMVLSPILILIGLLLASYPEINPEWMPWSKKMLDWAHVIFPREAEIPRYYSGLGLEFIALGIHFSNPIKDVLSNKYLLWFGKNSFAVYLLHGTILRTFLVWMMFGMTLPPDVEKDGKMVPGPPLVVCGRARWYFFLPIWFVILYSAANMWTKYVDPFCARLTQRFEKYCFEDTVQPNPREKPSLSPLPR